MEVSQTGTVLRVIGEDVLRCDTQGIAVGGGLIGVSGGGYVHLFDANSGRHIQRCVVGG